MSTASAADSQEIPLHISDLDIPEDLLAQALGYPVPEVPVAFKEIVYRIQKELEDSCALRSGYRLLSLEQYPGEPGRLKLGTQILEPGNIIGRQLQNVEKAALFVCTLGPGPEQQIAQWTERNDPASAFIADSIASLLAEQLAEQLHQYLTEKLSGEGLSVSNRFSPGYCGWNVKEQKQLFSLLPRDFCGIHLEESSFMQPRKSVSGIIGIGPQVKREDYPCARCQDNYCIYRNKKS